MQNIAGRLTSRSVVRSFDCSAPHPDFRILWKVSIGLAGPRKDSCYEFALLLAAETGAADSITVCWLTAICHLPLLSTQTRTL